MGNAFLTMLAHNNNFCPFLWTIDRMVCTFFHKGFYVKEYIICKHQPPHQRSPNTRIFFPKRHLDIHPWQVMERIDHYCINPKFVFLQQCYDCNAVVLQNSSFDNLLISHKDNVADICKQLNGKRFLRWNATNLLE